MYGLSDNHSEATDTFALLRAPTPLLLSSHVIVTGVFSCLRVSSILALAPLGAMFLYICRQRCRFFFSVSGWMGWGTMLLCEVGR